MQQHGVYGYRSASVAGVAADGWGPFDGSLQNSFEIPDLEGATAGARSS